MQADERALGIGCAQRHLVSESQPQRRDMIAQRIVRPLGIFAQLRALRLDPAILITAPIIPRPAIKAAKFHSRQIIGDEIGTQHVPFIDHAPQRAARRFEGEANRIAQARREDAIAAILGIDLQHRRAVGLGLHPVFADIAIGPDTDIEQPIRASRQAAGPMHIGGLGRQVQDLAARYADLQVARLIGKGHQRIAIRDVKHVADQRHAIGRLEPGQERRLCLGAAIAIGVA